LDIFFLAVGLRSARFRLRVCAQEFFLASISLNFGLLFPDDWAGSELILPLSFEIFAVTCIFWSVEAFGIRKNYPVL